MAKKRGKPANSSDGKNMNIVKSIKNSHCILPNFLYFPSIAVLHTYHSDAGRHTSQLATNIWEKQNQFLKINKKTQCISLSSQCVHFCSTLQVSPSPFWRTHRSISHRYWRLVEHICFLFWSSTKKIKKIPTCQNFV